jgi:peptidoglycan hydrolase CwlO-like protein
MDEQIRSHPIWEVIEQIKGQKGDPAFTESAGDQQAFQASQRIFQFVSLVVQRLQQAPASLISTTALTQIHGTLTSARNEIANFISNKNVGHLANAVSQIDGAGIPYLSQIPLVGSVPGGEALARIADELGNQTQGILKSILGERDRLQKEVERLVGQLGKLDGQVQTLTEAVAKQQAEALNVVKSVNTAYAAKEQEFQKAFDTATAAHAKAHEALAAKHDEAAKKDRESSNAAQKKLIQELEERLAHGSVNRRAILTRLGV